MRESKIKGKRYRYDAKSGKMVELKSKDVLPQGLALSNRAEWLEYLDAMLAEPDEAIFEQKLQRLNDWICDTHYEFEAKKGDR